MRRPALDAWLPKSPVPRSRPRRQRRAARGAGRSKRANGADRPLALGPAILAARPPPPQRRGALTAVSEAPVIRRQLTGLDAERWLRRWGHHVQEGLSHGASAEEGHEDGDDDGCAGRRRGACDMAA